MDRSTHEVRLANWKDVIQRCLARPKDQTAKQWLVENGIPEKQYYYWLRKVRLQAVAEIKPQLPTATDQLLQKPDLAVFSAESILAPEAVPAITIKTRKSTIEISSAIPESVMIKLIKAVTHAL